MPWLLGKGKKGGGAAAAKGPGLGGANALPPPYKGWFNGLTSWGQPRRCLFWNAGNCAYGANCQYVHRNVIDNSQRPAAQTHTVGTAHIK